MILPRSRDVNGFFRLESLDAVYRSTDSKDAAGSERHLQR
jgi:hypothetical protein